MADVKWIKITTDMFDNRKIKHLRRLPEGNSIVLIWVMLLTMAGRCNAGGMIFLTENIPYTPKMLADELDFEENTICLALEALNQLGMIVMKDNYFAIAGWEEIQSTARLSEIREYNRLAKQKSRAKQRLLQGVTDVSMTSQTSQEIDIEEDIEEDIDKDIEKEEIREEADDVRPSSPAPYESIKSMYNEICVSFPRCTSLSTARKKTIKARITSGYSLEDFETLFKKAEASSFLKGKNDRNWSATFDWLIKDTNMAKVLDGNYDNQPGGKGRKELVPGWMEKDSMKEHIQNLHSKHTVKDNPELKARAEKLRQSLGS